MQRSGRCTNRSGARGDSEADGRRGEDHQCLHRNKEEKRGEQDSQAGVAGKAPFVRTRPTERKVLRRQAKKAGPDIEVKCRLMRGNVLANRKPLKELHVEGGVTEDGALWKDELQRHCEEVHAEETAERRRGS